MLTPEEVEVKFRQIAARSTTVVEVVAKDLTQSTLTVIETQQRGLISL